MLSTPKTPTIFLEVATSGNFCDICYAVTRIRHASSKVDMKHWFTRAADGTPAAVMHPRDLVDLTMFLYEQTRDGIRICTWGGLGYDFRLLYNECPAQWEAAVVAANHVDPMYNMYATLGYLVSLEAVATKTIVNAHEHMQDLMPGKEVPHAWHASIEGKRAVSKSVQTQARLLNSIVNEIEHKGRVFWTSKAGYDKTEEVTLQNVLGSMNETPPENTMNVRDPAEWLRKIPGFDPDKLKPKEKPSPSHGMPF